VEGGLVVGMKQAIDALAGHVTGFVSQEPAQRRVDVADYELGIEEGKQARRVLNQRAMKRIGLHWWFMQLSSVLWGRKKLMELG
jgi:hypothetical protein